MIFEWLNYYSLPQDEENSDMEETTSNKSGEKEVALQKWRGMIAISYKYSKGITDTSFKTA